MEDKYYHSVRLEKEKCMGCTNCIKRCPTEAIRVHDGKATIMKSRCIDCGECIRACPHSAKRAVTDDFEMIKQLSTEWRCLRRLYTASTGLPDRETTF